MIRWRVRRSSRFSSIHVAQAGPGPDERLVHELDAALVDGEETAGRQACRRRRAGLVASSISSHDSRRLVSGVSSPGVTSRRNSRRAPRRARARRDVRTRPRPTARSHRRHRPRRGSRRASRRVPRRRSHVSIKAWEMSGRPPGSSPASSRIASVSPGSSRRPARCAGPSIARRSSARRIGPTRTWLSLMRSGPATGSAAHRRVEVGAERRSRPHAAVGRIEPASRAPRGTRRGAPVRAPA